MAGVLDYMCVDKWGEAKRLYLLTHQHGDHLRKAEALPGEVTLIVSEARDTKFGTIKGAVLANYYDYCRKHTDFGKIIVKPGEVTEISEIPLSIRVLKTNFHSDIFHIRLRDKTAIVLGDFDPEETEIVFKIIRDVSADEVCLPVYSPSADHKEHPYGKGVLFRECNWLGKCLKSRRYMLKIPKIVAMGHSEGTRKPRWADEYVPPIPEAHTFASP